MKAALFEIPEGDPRFKRSFDVIPERPFVLPGCGHMELSIGVPGHPDEVLVYDKAGKLTDRVPVTLVNSDTPAGTEN